MLRRNILIQDSNEEMDPNEEMDATQTRMKRCMQHSQANTRQDASHNTRQEMHHTARAKMHPTHDRQHALRCSNQMQAKHEARTKMKQEATRAKMKQEATRAKRQDAPRYSQDTATPTIHAHSNTYRTRTSSSAPTIERVHCAKASICHDMS